MPKKLFMLFSVALISVALSSGVQAQETGGTGGAAATAATRDDDDADDVEGDPIWRRGAVENGGAGIFALSRPTRTCR